MTRVQDIELAVSLGVDAIGLIFYPGSARCVSIPKAAELLRHVPLFVDVVAVMVNPQAAEVEKITGELPIQWLQFHGDEPPAFCEQFGKPWIKAIPARDASVIKDAMAFWAGASAVLLDTPSAQRGGAGQVFDWGMIPLQRTRPIILAGGLDANNVAHAVSLTHPAAVDVCTGIESSPGIKDHDRMIQFVNALARK